MNERLLQYIWQFQYFNKQELQTTEEEVITILSPGLLNTDQGPDFSHAKIKVGLTTWAGSVEVHIKTSDWIKHGHVTDAHYNRVILHVVWEDDSDVITNSGLLAAYPVLELCNRVPKSLLQRYEQLLLQQGFIACENSIKHIGSIVWEGWKERLLAERLTRKAAIILQDLDKTRNFWEEVFWWHLAANFGLKVNREAFEAIARSLPVTILARHRHQLHQLEALLLGQAGLLKAVPDDAYGKLLQKEYRYLQKKYKLPPTHLPVYFLRMRPANFPTIRLAQLAMLIHHSVHLFTTIKETAELTQLTTLFAVGPNDYWLYHYRFGEPGVYREKQVGKAMIDSVMINTVCPILFAYGSYHDDAALKEKAVNWLLQTRAEHNTVVHYFKQQGVACRYAADSQALLELKSQYCQEKRCLDCAVGHRILKTT